MSVIDDARLARLVVELGLLTPSQLEAALRLQEQEAPRRPLAAVLVSTGLVSGAQFDALEGAFSNTPSPSRPLVPSPPPTSPLPAVRASDPTVVLPPPTPDRPPASAPPDPARAAAADAPPPARRPAADSTSPSMETVLATPGRLGVAAAPLDSAATASAGPAHPAGRPPGPRPRTLGRYLLVEELGRGGMGVVYKAWHSGLRAFFAVKVLLAGDHASGEELVRFRREAQAAARLRHRGIVAVHDIGEEDGRTFIAMEYVNGVTLDRLLDDPAAAGLPSAGGSTPPFFPPVASPPAPGAPTVSTLPATPALLAPAPLPAAPLRPAPPPADATAATLPTAPPADAPTGEEPSPRRRPRRAGGLHPREAVRIVQEIAEALQAAHDAGVIHRDLKPANVIRDRGGRVAVMDFGLAKVVEPGSSGGTLSGMLLGTPAYMSPEQAAGRIREIDARSDIYQIGTILYELLTGRPPYAGGTSFEIIARVLAEEPPPPRRVAPAVDPDAETLCLRAMARAKEHRYAAASDLAEDCRRYLAGTRIHARREAAWARPLRWLGRRRLVASLAAVALLAAAVAGAAALRAASEGRAKARAEQARQAADQDRERAEAEQARLAGELLRGLRRAARSSLDAALLVRRAGGRLRDVTAKLLPPLEEAVRAVVERAPGLAEPHYHLGRTYRALLRPDDALRQAEEALRKQPDFLPSRYERAILLAARYPGRCEELRRRWSRLEGERLAAAGLLDDRPPLPAPRPGAAGSSFSAVPVRAEPSDEELAARDPATARLLRDLAGDLDFLAKADAEAGASASSSAPAGEAEPATVSSGLLRCARGVALAFLSLTPADRTEARLLLEAAAGEEAFSEEACYALGHLTSRSGDPLSAIAAYTRGLEADRGCVPFFVLRAKAWRRVARERVARGEDPTEAFEHAEADLARALELDPEGAETLATRGRLREERGAWLAGRGRDPAPQWRLA
ncbi:MAG: serine/threonine protein kinase, partial [Planctomycetes bacterium]|nr:serine/threonine protein kinase [Planctomycetota bacterium]